MGPQGYGRYEPSESVGESEQFAGSILPRVYAHLLSTKIY